VSGWQIQALKAAKLAKLEVPGVSEALKRAGKYLDADRGPKGGYGYRGPEDRYSLTGDGILCQILCDAGHEALIKGMGWLMDETEKNRPVKYQGEHADLYAWYYHTRACLLFGGIAWKQWHLWLEDDMIGAQNADGSWPTSGGKTHGPQDMETTTGKVYRTALCTLMLSAQYRILPTLQGP